MSNDEQFAVGTTVKLRSGGPDMTVKSRADKGTLSAQWFAGKKLEQGFFPVASLEEVKPTSKAE